MLSIALAALAAASTPLQTQMMDEPDEVRLFSDGPFLIPDRPPTGSNRNWIRFGTDACGIPDRVQSARSILRQSALDEDVDDGDELDFGDEAWGMISDWFSLEPEIAVLSDGVDKSCDDGFSPFDDEEPGAIAMGTTVP